MNNRQAGLDLIKKNAIIALFTVDDFISHGFIPLFLPITYEEYEAYISIEMYVRC